MRKLILLVLLLTPVFLSAQVDAKTQFKIGNEAYAEKNYEVALEYYNTVLEEGYSSPELYFNLGNTYYQLDNVGASILNYEKALKHAPEDEDIQFNLKMANLRVADRAPEKADIFFFSGFKNMLINYASDRWAKLFIIFLWLSFFSFAAFVWFDKPSVKRLSFFGGVFLALFALVFLVFSIQQYVYQSNNKSAIVMVTNTYVKSRPDAESTDLFILREGVKVKVLDQVESWRKVRFSEEKVGWIEIDKLGLI